ncbi:MAG: DinB family protein [Bacillota bacterium]
MKDYFFKLFKYNEWANNQVLDALINLPDDSPEEITRIFNHLITAQMMWLNRILGKSTVLELWTNNTIEGCITASKESSTQWLRFIEGLKEEDLSREISYVNVQGKPFVNTLEDILIHLVNHSTYHRAQIAILFRQNSLTPPVTDYIVYVREGGKIKESKDK